MRLVHRPASIIAAALLAGAVPGLAQQPSLALLIGPDSVEVQQASPGGDVALLSAQRTPVGFASRLETAVRTGRDLQGNGVVRFELGEPVQEASVWLAVDLSSGRFAVASPVEGAPFAFPEPLGLTSDPGTQVVAAIGHPTLELLLVRAGTGIWHAVAADGGVSEDSGVADGRTDLLAPQWELLAGSPESPGALEPTDLLFALDPAAFQLDAQLVGGLHDLP